MAVKIEWTDPVLQDLKSIVFYIENEWSEAIADKFVELVKERVKDLAKYPYMGMDSGKNSAIRSIKLSKHNRLYYRLENDILVLLNIFDTRQHPDKNLYS
jgi:plasmid stabilization system protein ParE